MKVLNFFKDSIMAGFLSNKAFSRLKKETKFESAVYAYLIVMFLLFVFIFGITYLSIPSTAEIVDSNSVFNNDLVMVFIYSMSIILFSITSSFFFVFISKLFYNLFTKKKKKKLMFKEMFIPYSSIVVAQLLPLLILLALIIIIGLNTFLPDMMILTLIFGLIICCFLYFIYLYGLVYYRLLDISFLNIYGVLFLSIIVTYISTAIVMTIFRKTVELIL